jgi:hypothetical protein
LLTQLDLADTFVSDASVHIWGPHLAALSALRGLVLAEYKWHNTFEIPVGMSAAGAEFLLSSLSGSTSLVHLAMTVRGEV